VGLPVPPAERRQPPFWLTFSVHNHHVAQLENFRFKVFRTVAEHLNFRKAAEHLFLTQRAVTLQIKALENDLGVRLFGRTAVSGNLGRKMGSFDKPPVSRSKESFVASRKAVGDQHCDLVPAFVKQQPRRTGAIKEQLLNWCAQSSLLGSRPQVCINQASFQVSPDKTNQVLRQLFWGFCSAIRMRNVQPDVVFQDLRH